MKKVKSLIAIAVLTVSIAACSGSRTSTSNGTNDTQNPGTTSPSSPGTTTDSSQQR